VTNIRSQKLLEPTHVFKLAAPRKCLAPGLGSDTGSRQSTTGWLKEEEWFAKSIKILDSS